MKDFPHHYSVTAKAGSAGEVVLASEGLAAIRSAPPAEFGGPGDKWSPETLLVAAIADCFILTFRAIAGPSKLAWNSLQCEVNGTLDRVEGALKFTGFSIHASLTVPMDTNEERARRLLEKAEQNCLITNSLSGTIHLDTAVVKAS